MIEPKLVFPTNSLRDAERFLRPLPRPLVTSRVYMPDDSDASDNAARVSLEVGPHQFPRLPEPPIAMAISMGSSLEGDWSFGRVRETPAGSEYIEGLPHLKPGEVTWLLAASLCEMPYSNSARDAIYAAYERSAVDAMDVAADNGFDAWLIELVIKQNPRTSEVTRLVQFQEAIGAAAYEEKLEKENASAKV